MFGVGPIFEFPTATKKTFLGTQKWSAGPTGVVVYSKGKFLGGALIQNLFSFAGNAKRQAVNEMTLQPFINYNLPKEWYICSSPLITANWEASGSQVWTVPVGLGLGRLVHFGKLPVNIALQGYYNLVRPDNQPDWTIRLGVTLLFPEK